MVKLIKILSLSICLSLIALFPIKTFSAQQESVIVRFFWGNGCPHCEHEKQFLKDIEKKHPKVKIYPYEVWYNTTNKNLYERLAKAYESTSGSVPATFIGKKVFIGFNSKLALEIESAIQLCSQTGCPDPLNVIMPDTKSGKTETTVLKIPALGTFDAANMSLPALTIVLGMLDGFNPCAFFVLLTLLSLLVYAKSRSRMLLVGAIFIFFSGFIYFVFMAAWLNLFLVIGSIKIITTIAGIAAILIAAINIKDYFIFKTGVSLTIPEKAKPILYERMRKIIHTGSLAGIISGTIILAILANMYELLCTAGFPMVFTRVLTLHELPKLNYYGYLLLYNVIYVLPLAVIVLIFTFTLGSRKLTEDEGRVLKLISGLMMLGLGVILVINPALLNNILTTLIFLITILIISAIIIKTSKPLLKKRKPPKQ